MAKRYSSPPELTIDLDTNYSATLHTTMGDITIEFFPADAPLAVNNFLFLAEEGFYDGVIFHRIVPGFVIQGGDPGGDGRGGPGYSFRDELGTGRDYSRGTVAMANAGPNTNGSQFFICLDDVGLPNAYTIFGKVTDGMDVVHEIGQVETGPGDRPREDVVMEKVTVNEDG